MKIMRDGRYHWDPSGLLGSPSPVNMCVGGRTTGKTFAMNYQAIKNYIRKGEHFAVLTRYDTQVEHVMKNPYMQPVTDAGYFPGWETRTDGTNFLIRKDGGTWDKFGDCLAMTKYEDYKRTAFPRTTMLIFDEFIKDTTIPPYLKNEPDMLMNVWSSITRRSDRCRVYMLANNVSLSNPYFAAWGIHLPAPGKTKTIKHGRSSVTIENLFSADFIADSSDDMVSKFTAGSVYEQMAVFNQHHTNVTYRQKPKTASFKWEFKVAGRSMGIWATPSGDWYVSQKIPRGNRHAVLVVVKDDWVADAVIIKRSHGIMKMLEKVARQGFLYFEDPDSQYNFDSIYPLLGM